MGALMRDQLDPLIPEHESMLAAYRAKDWDAAEKAIAACRAAKVVALDKYYGLFASRIATWRENPPPADWDGVFTATEK